MAGSQKGHSQSAPCTRVQRGLRARPCTLGPQLGRSFWMARRPAPAWLPLTRPRTTRAWRTRDAGDARGKFTPGARGAALLLPRVGSGARGGPGTARPAGRPERAWARAPRGCTAWPSLRWCRGSAAKRGRGPAPWKPLPERGSRGCGRCLFKVTACSGTTWGGQLGTGHLTDSGVTSGSPLVCGTRSA